MLFDYSQITKLFFRKMLKVGIYVVNDSGDLINRKAIM